MGKSSSRSEKKSAADSKFEKKLKFYEKVRTAVAQKAISKEIKKKKLRSRQKKLKAYDLSSLTEYLPELTEPRQPKPTELKVNCKTRNNLVLKESNQLKMVINHPAFASDPMGAIYQHLQSTQPCMDEKPKKKEGKTGKKKQKKKKVKGSSAPDSMEE